MIIKLAKEICLEDVKQLEVEKLVLGTVATNCYIISNPQTKQAIIIDPADRPQIIDDYIQTNDLCPVAILLTHGHFDHIFAVAQLSLEYHIKVYAQEEEKGLLEDAHLNYSYYVGRETIIQPDILLSDREMVTLGGMRFTCIHTPGHTQGSCCYYFEAYGFIITGDTIFMESIGRTDLPTGNANKIVTSIQEKLFCLEDDVYIFPGHGERSSIGFEKKYNPYVKSRKNDK